MDHFINKSGFAVVNVRNYGNVSDILHVFQNKPQRYCFQTSKKGQSKLKFVNECRICDIGFECKPKY